MGTGAETSLLGGKVLKRSLPVFQGAPGPDAPALKRLMLSQGELAQIHDSAEGIRYMAFIELREAGIRGNHYHKEKQELVYVIKGGALLSVEDVASHNRAAVVLRAGDLAVIQTEVAHAFQTMEVGEAIEFSPIRFNPADLFPFALTPR
jgi:hypothetical protein